jgi:hypothetical protein
VTGRQLALVLALAIIAPLLCGMVPACGQSAVTIKDLCTFIAGGMIGLAQAQAKAAAQP